MIGPTGGVEDARFVTTALDDPAFEACVLGVLGRTRFAVPPGGGRLQIGHPLVFIPEGWPSAEDQAPPG